ncbi:hypothetical protein ABEB36_005173 [Hypothenemus hampei]|uniref:EDR1/CTR1/ARMC3-like peptidase-like domain-containing protein n=1 Tax=Hypothenemus hampei TaxID=57062 RepID=A0ABD1EXV6_HYPHA
MSANNLKVKQQKNEQNEQEKPTKLDKTKQSDLKEKIYTTRQVDTSVTILDSPENDVVLEALLFLSKYADINKNNVVNLVKIGTVEKLLNNLKKNICILRLSVRLLSNLLGCEEGIYELDQDKYNDKVIDIATMYMEHKDSHVKGFCVEILAKIANSCRITTLIFKVDLFNPIFDHMRSLKSGNVLYFTMLLFYELINAPAAVCVLPECPRYDLNVIISHLHHKENKISNIVLDILEKLSRYGLPFLQESLKKYGVMEKMFKIVMNEEKLEQHQHAFNIIHNCLNSNETCSYFVESIEFLELCQWLKTCNPKFFLPLIEIFITLTAIPEMKQILFDLSVEETIMYFFKYKNKLLINKTCKAISNMTTHKYCCETMLTPVIADILIEILQRQNDEEDRYNEVALKTVFHFTRRYARALSIFLDRNFSPVLLNYFLEKSEYITEESFLMVLEILYKCLVHPAYQKDFLTEEILNKILQLFRNGSVTVSTMCCEIMSNIVTLESFRKFFLRKKGASVCMEVLNNTNDLNLLTQTFFLIFCCLVYEDVAMVLLHSGLIGIMKKINSYILEKIPIHKKVKKLALQFYPPIKFYETGRMEITEKLPNKFYVINGLWNGPFPFLEILEMMHVSPYSTIYIVDYSYEVVKGSEIEIPSQISLGTVESSVSRSSGSLTESESNISTPEVPSVFDINYGHISKDVFLPRYIYHLQKYEKYIEGGIENRIRLLAEYVDILLCGVKENLTLPQKIHEYRLHIECLKQKLGNNIIPVGFLRMGFHCERALLFKALADKICIPCSLVKGSLKVYWNEVALFEETENQKQIKFYIVDLIHHIGNLMLVGSREANKYCNFN